MSGAIGSTVGIQHCHVQTGDFRKTRGRTMKNWKIKTESEIVVIGHNDELIDISNRNGEIHGKKFYVVARAEDGTQYAHGHMSDSETEIQELARVIRVAVLDGENFDPTNPLYWYPIDPVYGSEAWILINAEESIIAWEKRIDEDFEVYS